MWWAVILNEAKRNEESLTSVAALEEILRPAEAGLRMTGLAHVTALIIRGACHGSRPRNDTQPVIANDSASLRAGE